MLLEALAESARVAAELPEIQLVQQGDAPFQLDAAPVLAGLLNGMKKGVASAELALGFHGAVSSAVVAGCKLIRQVRGHERVVLSGGVFQNRLLSEMVYTSLAGEGFTVFSHRLVPPNDGGICLGQAVIAARQSGL